VTQTEIDTIVATVGVRNAQFGPEKSYDGGETWSPAAMLARRSVIEEAISPLRKPCGYAPEVLSSVVGYFK
jgi:hypothetical protein